MASQGGSPQTRMCHAAGGVRGNVTEEVGVSLDLEGQVGLSSQREGAGDQAGSKREQRLQGRKNLWIEIPPVGGPTALPPLHAPAFVTVERVEEMRPSVRHGGAGELWGSRPAGQSDPGL